jgi:hypothetical protein
LLSFFGLNQIEKKGDRMKKFLYAILAVLLMAGVAFAWAGASTTTMDAQDATVINRSSPALTRTSLGTRLRGPLTTGITTSAACATTAALCNTVATTETTAVTLKTTGAAWVESFALANGQQDQVKTYVLVTDGGQDFYVTPTTKTGFTSVQLSDAKDSVSLKYINSTVGWVIIGNNAATIN